MPVPGRRRESNGPLCSSRRRPAMLSQWHSVWMPGDINMLAAEAAAAFPGGVAYTYAAQDA